MKTPTWKLGVGRWQLGLFCFIILHSSFCLRVQGQSYTIAWYEIAGGGGTSTGGTYQVSGTIGQPDASGAMSGGNYSVTGGYLGTYQCRANAGCAEIVDRSQRREQR